MTKEYEMELAKKGWDAHLSNSRSRSAMRSKDIMERARSFERRAAEVAASSSRPDSRASLPSSRRGSFSHGLSKSPSASTAFWKQVVASPATSSAMMPSWSSCRWNSVGRLDTSNWEAKSTSTSRDKARLIEQWAKQKTEEVISSLGDRVTCFFALLTQRSIFFPR